LCPSNGHPLFNELHVVAFVGFVWPAERQRAAVFLASLFLYDSHQLILLVVHEVLLEAATRN
jgi:hypothetical protein